MKNILKRWMYAQMYGAKVTFLQKVGICFFLWHYKKFTIKASYYVAFHPTTMS